MKLRVTQRHFVSNEENLNSLERGISRTIDAQQKKPQIDFSFAVGYRSNSLEILDGLTKQIKRLAEKNIRVNLGDNGPGDAWLSSTTDVIGLRSCYSDRELVEPPEGCLTSLVDMDQFDIKRSEVLDGMEIISKCLLEKDLILGLGARDRVSLAGTKELDEARKIEEMYHARFMNNIKIGNPLGIDVTRAPESYRDKDFGDPIPGCYLLNSSCRSYPQWYEALLRDSENAVLTRQVGLGDTIGVMEASTLAKEIPSIYLPVMENPPGAFRIETIKRKSVELGKTGVAKGYFGTVGSETNRKKLAKYYPEQSVDEVRAIILEGLKEGMKKRLTSIISP